MILGRHLIAGLLSLATSAYTLSIEDINHDPGNRFDQRTVPNRYIVQYEDSYGFEKRGLSSLSSSLSDIGATVEVNNEFDSAIFQGASITVLDSNSTTAETLKELDGVKNAWPVGYVTLDDSISAASFASWNPHALTGVDTLHERGFTGSDITIAIIDTGVDYNHPALGGGIGEGYTVVGGYDFSESLTDPTDDPMDCAGHGTFVSSLIVSNTDALKGVAPGAKIKMYKVFACEDSTQDDIIMAGLLKAYEDKPDVISLSLGADRGYNTFPLAQLASKIAQEIPVMFAAGNSGESGPFFASTGGSGIDVLAIASSHAKQLVAYRALATSSGGETFEFVYVSNDGSKFDANGSYKAVITSKNVCSLSYGEFQATEDNQLLISKFGNCYSQSLYNGLIGHGFTTAFTYLSSSSSHYQYIKADTSFGELKNLGQVSNEFGKWAVAQAAAGNEVTVEFSSDAAPVGLDDPQLNAGQIDYYTSWGPTFENNYYPHLAGPGGEVFGAGIGGGYYVGSGTSFACPYIAGVAALYLSAHKGTSPEELRRLLISSSNELDMYVNSETSYGSDFSTLNTTVRAPHIQQGSGLIDAVKMFDQGSKLISAPFLELNDTVHRVDTFEISIKNDNSEAVTYQLIHSPGVTVNSRIADSYFVNYYYPPYTESHASVEFSDESLTLAAGASGSVTVTIIAPTGVNTDDGPVFAGKIWFEGDNGDSVGVPYMGVELDTYNWTPWGLNPLALGYDSGNDWYYNLTESIYKDKEWSLIDGDSPYVYFNIRYGSEIISFDLVETDYQLSSFSYPPVAGEDGYLGPLLTSADAYGFTTEFPFEFAVRSNTYSFFNFQSFGNGTTVPTGRYRILASALRMFGDRSNPEDWQLAILDPFNVKGKDTESSSESLSASSIESSASSIESSSVSSTESSASSSISSVASSAISSLSASESSSVSASSTSSSTASGSVPTSAATRGPEVTGEDTVTAISIIDDITGTTDAFKDDWFTISITFDIPKPLGEDAVTEIGIPGFTDFTDGLYYLQTTASNLVGHGEYSDGKLIISWGDWVTWQQNIKGTIEINAHLSQEAKDSITGPGTKDFTFTTPGKDFTATLNFISQADAPRRSSFWDGEKPNWVVDVPGALGFSSVTIESVVDSFDYSYLCDDITAVIGTNLDNLGNATSAREAADPSTNTCQAKSQKLVTTETIGEDELYRVHFAAEPESLDSVFGNTMYVTVVVDGESRSYTFNDDIYISARDSLSVFTSERYVPPTSSSSSSSTVASGESSISSTVASAESSASSKITSSESSTESSSSATSLSTVGSSEASTAESSSSASPASSTTSSSSSSAAVSSSPAVLEPTISGAYNSGNPIWKVEIPGALGPWSNLHFEALSDSSFMFVSVKYIVDDVTYPVNSSSLSQFEFDSDFFSEDGFVLTFGGRIINGDSHTVNVIVSITTPDLRIVKRAVKVYELSNTITADAVSSDVSSSAASSSSTVASVSSAEISSSAGAGTSSSAQTGTSSSDVASNSVATAGSSSAAGISSSDVVSSSAAGTSWSGAVSSSAATTGSSSAVGVSSSDTVSSSAATIGSSSVGGISSSTVATGASSVASSDSDSASTTSTDASFTSTGAVITSTVDPAITSTAAVPENGTTVVTITSCSDNVCSETAVTTGVTVVTETKEGVVTSYTTYCPLTTAETIHDSTTLVIITSCSDNVCSETAVTTGVTVVTVTKEGVVTSYTTYCPLTTAETTHDSTNFVTMTSCSNVCSEVVKTTRVTEVTGTNGNNNGVSKTNSAINANNGNVSKPTGTNNGNNNGNASKPDSNTTITSTAVATHTVPADNNNNDHKTASATTKAPSYIGIDTSVAQIISGAQSLRQSTDVHVTVLTSQTEATPKVEPPLTSATVSVTSSTPRVPASAVISTFEGAANKYQISGVLSILSSFLFLLY